MTIPIFVDGFPKGYISQKKVAEWRKLFYEKAVKRQRIEQADHMIYGCAEYDENGNVAKIRFYSGIGKTDAEFEEISRLPHSHVYAIHKH